jgi:hypothetical protein
MEGEKGNNLVQVSPTVFARGPLLASRNNHGSSHRPPPYRAVRVNASYCKTLYLRLTLDSSERNNAFHNGTLTEMMSLASLVQEAPKSDYQTVGRNIHIATQRRFAIIITRTSLL